MKELTSNPVGHLTKYEFRHLAEHLEGSDRAEDLHRLLTIQISEERILGSRRVS